MLSRFRSNSTHPALRRWRLLCCVVCGFVAQTSVRCEASEKPSQFKEPRGMKTLGGRQFWGDLAFYRGWRIQQNVVTKHCRLLDPKDKSIVSGSQEKCARRLAEIRREKQLPPMSGKAVILVHGIIRSSKSFFGMSEALQTAGYTVVPFDYPSTRVSIPDSAQYLRSTIESLEGIDEINFVVHSMGGLVVREYSRKDPDPRIGRMVMLGVPNLGAVMADRLKKNIFFKIVMGPAGQQLITGGLIANLPTPPFPFAVIAGGRGTLKGYNPIVPGDDDGTVSIQSTRLAGAADFATVRSLHSFLMNQPESIEMSVRFLQTGALRATGERRPIALPEDTVIRP